MRSGRTATGFGLTDLKRAPHDFARPSQETESMADEIGVAGNRVRSFVERVEQLESEIAELNEQKKEVFAEAKGEGFDVKILREIIKIRKQDKEERDEHETLLDVYLRAMDSAEGEAEPMKEAA
jgi:uncharacterized protein (UPF0335 family)